jgi:amidohydrolase
MDALPVQEENDVPYRSKQDGMMHACGHDGHVTIALGTVRNLVESGWVKEGAGKVLFIFQPAEEGGGGARAMLQAGALEGEKVEAIFAGHLHPELIIGRVGMSRGVSNASSDALNIRITGKGGHGAQPQLCLDPVVAGAALVMQLQSIVSRSIAPLESAVITVGKFQAGTARNVIPERAVLEGTLRTLTHRSRETALRRIREVAAGVECAYGLTVELDVVPGYPLVVNDPGVVDYVMERAGMLFGEGNTLEERPRMGAEDFAFFLEKIPGVLIRVGCREPGTHFTSGLHSPHFNFDERTLDLAVTLFTDLLWHAAERPAAG